MLKFARRLPAIRWGGGVLLVWLVLVGVACSSPAGANQPTFAPTAVAQVVTATPTATATDLPTTFTPVPTVTNTPVPGATNTPIPSKTPVPTATPVPSATPTSRPQISNPLPTFLIPDPDLVVLSTAIPTPVATFEVPSNVTNVLLMGSDAPAGNEVSRTDSLIIVSIDRENKTASMLSLPRDLYVYIPGWTMGRINTALPHGSASGYPTGAVGLLKDTILYNFGIPIHYYGRVDFDGFKEIVDQVGGVDIAVSCRLEDWRLKSPDLDINEEDSYEWVALDPGIHHMDGFLALWYARSRLTTSDFDRGRRQQQLLRALLHKGLDLDLLPQVPALYDAFNDTVETDMDIGRILQLAAIAPAVRENGIQNLYLVGDQLTPWVVPESGAQVQLPNWDKMQVTFRTLISPPALNQALRSPIYVEIINATGNPEMALLAADNLATYGFIPVIGEAEAAPVETTSLSYYGSNLKGAFDWFVSWVVNMNKSEIELVSDDAYAYEYRLVLGADYNPCINQLYAPRVTVP